MQFDHLIQTVARKQFLPQTEYHNLVLASVGHIVWRTTPQIGSLMHNTLSACLIYHLRCFLIGPRRYYEALAACLWETARLKSLSASLLWFHKHHFHLLITNVLFSGLSAPFNAVCSKVAPCSASCKFSTWKKGEIELVPMNRQWCGIKMKLIGEHAVTGRQVPVLRYSEVNLIKPSKGFESRIRAKSSRQCHFYIKIHPTQGNSLPLPISALAAHESSDWICGDDVRPISKRQHMQS